MKRCNLKLGFRVGMTDGPAPIIAKYGDSGYDVSVFDELYFANVDMLDKIPRYSEINTNRITLATGDTNQLETKDFVSTQIDHETYGPLYQHRFPQ